MVSSTNPRKRGVLAEKISQRKGDVTAAECPSRGVLEHVTSRWGVLVLLVLRDGMHRFSELRRAIGGVSEKMLAQTLRDLENDGFVVRRVLPTIPPGVEYSLSPLGEEVSDRLEPLVDFIELNLPKVLKARAVRATVTSVP
jgi:DNA-binding HxlR family transcriptional regulator